jgi:large subunit ribosomal protein L21
MTYAIIETGGKQMRVEPGRFYDIELLHVEPDEAVTIDAVLLVEHNGEFSIGQPLVSGATVEGTIMRHFRDRKVLVYKMKPKKKTRKKRGHRQEVTRLMINSITMNGSVLASTSDVETDVVSEPVAVEPDTITVASEPVVEPDTITVASEPVIEPDAVIDETSEPAAVEPDAVTDETSEPTAE